MAIVNNKLFVHLLFAIKYKLHCGHNYCSCFRCVHRSEVKSNKLNYCCRITMKWETPSFQFRRSTKRDNMHIEAVRLFTNVLLTLNGQKIQKLSNFTYLHTNTFVKYKGIFERNLADVRTTDCQHIFYKYENNSPSDC